MKLSLLPPILEEGVTVTVPKMLTKIIIYACIQRIYSSRQIAEAVRENIMFMWIAGSPDFRAINRFRSERMKDTFQTIFTAILQLLIQEGDVQLEKMLKKSVRKLRKDLLPRLQKYETQEMILGLSRARGHPPYCKIQYLSQRMFVKTKVHES